MFSFRYRIFSVLLMMCFAGIPAGVIAQEVLTIEDAIRTGLEQNYGIRVSRLDLEKRENDVTLGNAGMLPRIGVDVSRGYTVTDVNQTFQDGRVQANDGIKANSYNLGGRLDWTLFDGMGMFLEYDRLELLRTTGELQYRAAAEALVADIAITYTELVRQQVLLRVLDESIEISKQRLKIAEDKFEVGRGARVEVLQAQVALNADESAWNNQRVVIQHLKVELNTLLARDADYSFEIVPEIDFQGDLEFETIRNDAFASNVAVTAARLEKVLAGTERKRIAAERFPVIGAYAGYTFTGSENSASFFVEQRNKGVQYGVTARVNLFDGFNTSRRIQNARIDEKVAALAEEETLLALNAEIEMLYASYRNALDQLKMEELNQQLAVENAAIALERFQLGTYTPVELREAQQALLDAESRFISARYSAKTSEIRLLQLAGKSVVDLK